MAEAKLTLTGVEPCAHVGTVVNAISSGESRLCIARPPLRQFEPARCTSWDDYLVRSRLGIRSWLPGIVRGGLSSVSINSSTSLWKNLWFLISYPTFSRWSERKNRLPSRACLTASRSFRGGLPHGTGSRRTSRSPRLDSFCDQGHRLIDMIDRRLVPDEQEVITPGEAVAGMILNGLGFANRPL